MPYKKKKYLIIISAPSGGGKSTICSQLLVDREDIEYSISYTTRKPREGEVDGEDYYFISREEFEEKIKIDDFLEFAEVHNNLYGTCKNQIKKSIANGKHVLLDIDVQGASIISDSGIEMISIFILPPSERELEKRLKNRATDSEDQIKVRLKNAEEEIDKVFDFQYLVINDELPKAVDDVKNIIACEELKTNRYKNIFSNFYGG